MSNQDETFGLVRDPAWGDDEYLERQRLHDAKMRIRAASALKHAASVVLELMLSVPASDDPCIEHLQHFLSVAGRVASTGEIRGWLDPEFHIALTELRRAMRHARELIGFQGRWK